MQKRYKTASNSCGGMGFVQAGEPTIPHRTSRLKCVKHEIWVGTSMVMRFGYVCVGIIGWFQIPPNQWLLSLK